MTIDPRRAEQLIRQAQGNARAPIRAQGNNPDLLRQREAMAAEGGRLQRLQSSNAVVGSGLAPDLSRIVWPDERDKDGNPMALGSRNPDMVQYGYEHGKQTAELALVIAKHLGVTNKDELKMVEGAARFHDLGRTRPWQYQDTHAALSAQRAAELMHNDPTLWSNPAVREGICGLIVRHSLSGSPPTDPRLVALWDADCFESVRFLETNTREAVTMMHARLRLCITKWAQTKENQVKWRDHRSRS